MVFEKKKIFIVVKTYPNPSKKYQETVCVAGVLLDDPPSWIRLYPIPFRNLPQNQQFKKYTVIEAEIRKNPQDARPESHKVNAESIQTIETIGTENNWRKRKEFLLPLADPSMCQIQADRDIIGKSLGLFKPLKIEDFIIESTEKRDWDDSEKQILSQMNLFDPSQKALEKIPFKFKIRYFCSDSKCSGHTQGLIDWETGELYRKVIKNYDEPTALEKIRDKYLSEIFNPKRDPYLIVGNQFGGPLSFLILSVFWPPVDKQLPLF